MDVDERLLGRLEQHLIEYDSDKDDLWSAIQNIREDIHGEAGNNGMKSRLKSVEVKLWVFGGVLTAMFTLANTAIQYLL